MLTTPAGRETDTQELITQGREKGKLSRADSSVLGVRRVRDINCCSVQFVATAITNLIIIIISSRLAFFDIKG